MKFLLVLAAAAALTAPASAQSSNTSPAMPTCKAGNPVVWLNTDSNVYFKQDSALYGKTKQGKYVCRNTAVSMGAHKAKTGGMSAHQHHHMAPGAMAPGAMASPASSH